MSVRIMVLNVDTTLQWSLDQGRVGMRMRAMDTATGWNRQPGKRVRAEGAWAWAP